VSQFKKGEQVEFTIHDLRHLRVTRTVTKLRKEASGDPATEAALLEGFQYLMGWQSPETMATYLKTMNKRQAISAILEDEEAQERAENCPLLPPVLISGQKEPVPNQEPVPQTNSQAKVPDTITDEFNWYEDEE
jgi:hypothetical protein